MAFFIVSFYQKKAMWNYEDADKWITLENLMLLTKWLDESGKGATYGSYMVDSITRKGDEYTIGLTVLQHSFDSVFSIKAGIVTHLRNTRFMMS